MDIYKSLLRQSFLNEQPFVLIAEDKWIGRFESHEAADLAGLASGKEWYEIIDLRGVRKMTG